VMPGFRCFPGVAFSDDCLPPVGLEGDSWPGGAIFGGSQLLALRQRLLSMLAGRVACR
jgi:hypothetical protein